MDFVKTCLQCGRVFPLTPYYFYRDKNIPDGFHRRCKECDGHSFGEFRPSIQVPHGYKYCSSKEKCVSPYGHVMPLTSEFFTRANTKQTGYRSSCKFCDKAKRDAINNSPEGKEKTRVKNLMKKEYLKNYRKSYVLPEMSKNKIKERISSFDGKLKRRVIKLRYRARKQSLPDTLSTTDWENALEYFNWCCAVCGRQFNNLFETHTAAADHWIPLSNPLCPGSVPENIVPLCHGEQGCNNSKNNRDPVIWLIDKLGKKKAKLVLKRINDYFDYVRRIK